MGVLYLQTKFCSHFSACLESFPRCPFTVVYMTLTQLLGNHNRAAVLGRLFRKCPALGGKHWCLGRILWKLCCGLTKFPLKGGKEGAHYTHPALAPAAISAPRGARAWDRKQSIQHHDEAKNYLSITQSRENKPFISVCHQLEAGMVGFASRSSPGRVPGRLLGWALSVCPGFPVLGVLLALLQPQRGSSFCLGQGSEGGQVGG